MFTANISYIFSGCFYTSFLFGQDQCHYWQHAGSYTGFTGSPIPRMAHQYPPLSEGLLYLPAQSQENGGDSRRLELV